MTQPPAYPFPTSPAKTTTERLAHLPLLVAEILLTLGVGAPNPGERAGRGRRPKPGSKPPGSLDVVELTICEDDRPGSLVPLPRLVECSRLIWESLADDEKADLGVPESPPSWRAECAWLERAWPTAQATLDASVYEWVEDEIAAVYGQLASMARLSRPRRYLCPTCGDTMQLQNGDYFICDSGVHQHPGPVALQQQWRRKPPATAREIVAMFTEARMRVSEEQLRQWRARRKIPHAGERGRFVLYLPWDVMRCLLPEVVDALDLVA